MLFNTVLFLLIVSHMRAVFSDPGIVALPKTGLDFSDIHSDKRYQDTVSAPLVLILILIDR